jgi:hypothetical protein
MRLEGVAIIPTCEECEAAWLPADDEPWSAYLTDNEPPAFYCPECAAREFGAPTDRPRALTKSNVKSLDTHSGDRRDSPPSGERPLSRLLR